MPVPNLCHALKGWVKLKKCQVVTQDVVDHQTVESTEDLYLKINLQPVPPAKVVKKPEEQRTWKWWNLLIKGGEKLWLKNDDKVIIDNKPFRVMSEGNWTEYGFQSYEIIEDYNGS